MAFRVQEKQFYIKPHGNYFLTSLCFNQQILAFLRIYLNSSEIFFVAALKSLWLIKQIGEHRTHKCSTCHFSSEIFPSTCYIHNIPNLCKFKNKLPLSISVNNLAIPLQLIIVMGTRQRKSYTSLGKLLSKDAFDYMKQQSPSK